MLAPLEEIKVCVGYKYGDEILTHVPYHQTVIHHVEPVYETLPGWGEEIDEVTSFSGLPDAAQAYVRFIEETVGVPIRFVGVGPAREQTVFMERD